jgi:signal peptidase I
MTASLRSYTVVLVAAMILAVFVRTWLIQAYVVPSGSMAPTLRPGDHLLVNKFIFRSAATTRLLPARRIRRGDVLVFRDPRQPDRLLVKRCVALPGDRVRLVDKILLINGSTRSESYAVYSDPRTYPASRFLEDSLRPRDNFGPLTLGPAELFCLGDQRDISLDSRHWGAVPLASVLGRAAVVYRHGPMPEREQAGDLDPAAPLPEQASAPTPRWVR